MKSAPEHLQHVAGILAERGKTHGVSERERSMGLIVELFEAMTGVKLTVPQGWQFMLALKLGRMRANGAHLDNYHDAMGYLALLVEEVEQAAA